MDKKGLIKMNKEEAAELATKLQDDGALDTGPFYHGTKADLKQGDLLEPSHNSNYGERKKANYVYLTATLDAAKWGAELAVGGKPGRIYRVEPTGTIEDDPNLTDKKFPGNPTRSYPYPTATESGGRSLGLGGTLPRGAPENAGSTCRA